MLDKQVFIYMLDTGHLYTNREKHLHFINAKYRQERNYVKNHTVDLENQLLEFGYTQEEIKKLKNLKYDKEDIVVAKDFLTVPIDNKVEVISGSESIVEEYIFCQRLILYKRALAKSSKQQLLDLISKKNQLGNYVRSVRTNDIHDTNVVATFDSCLTRAIDAQIDEITTDIFTLQVYYYGVFEDAMLHGVTWNGEKYVYLTSSAGMIRKKRAVFIKESVWERIQKKLLCGLTVEKINEKGGCNTNKYLSYLALSNSATDVWEDFDIDRTIVVKDYEATVHGEVDFIDDLDYSITRQEGDYLVNHIDGAGMVLSSCLSKNVMIRMPWVKGALGVFDFRRFIKEHNCSPIIKDIYGKEHDIIAEDIQIIFSESQFKMAKYYSSWEEYKEFFKKYNCECGLCNEEEEYIKNATINYQMLQQTVDFTEEELDELVSKSVRRVRNVCKNLETIKDIMGVNRVNSSMTSLQRAIKMYPPLLNDTYTKDTLREIKDSLVKQFRAGKLMVNGKYTFVLPDFYAACEYWFLGIEKPKGLLENGEIFCNLFARYDKIVCLRSPSLYHETPVRNNVAHESYGERAEYILSWFDTKAIYTSVSDLITRILQLDCDGDHLLLVADPVYVRLCEKNMQGVVPLYYEAKKAKVTLLTPETIYAGLNAAFSSTKIGLYSNSISKIWGSDVFVTGTPEEKQEALDTIKRLCLESNLSIDSAKTQYIVKRPNPDWFTPIVSKFTNKKLPAFFEYAKDKSPSQVEPRTGTFVNRIFDKIPNPKITLRNIGLEEFDIRVLMSNPDIECPEEVAALYDAENKIYKYKINQKDEFDKSVCYLGSSERKKFRELGYTDEQITDMLIKHTYGGKQRYKQLLWFCWGRFIINNMKVNLASTFREMKIIQCVDCGEYIEVPMKDTMTCRCHECNMVHKTELARLRKQKQREK